MNYFRSLLRSGVKVWSGEEAGVQDTLHRQGCLHGACLLLGFSEDWVSVRKHLVMVRKHAAARCRWGSAGTSFWRPAAHPSPPRMKDSEAS